MTIDQLAGELMDVIFDASLLGVCDRVERLTGRTEAAGGRS